MANDIYGLIPKWQTLKSRKWALLMTLGCSVVYFMLWANVAMLKAQAAAEEVPSMDLVLNAGTNFILRIYCLLALLVFALKASTSSILPCLLMAANGALALNMGMVGQAWYFGTLALLCFSGAWTNLVEPPWADEAKQPVNIRP